MFVTCPHCGVRFVVPAHAPSATTWPAQCTRCTGLFETIDVPRGGSTTALPPPATGARTKRIVFGMATAPTTEPTAALSGPEMPTQPRELPAEAYLNRRLSPPFPLTYRELMLQGVLLPAPMVGGKPMVRGRVAPALLDRLLPLTAPWLPVRAAPSTDGFVAERLVGVSASSAGRELAAQKRFFPLEVWLRLADVMLAALEGLTVGGTVPYRLHPLWSMWAGPHALSATIDRRLVMTGGPMGLPVLAREVPAITGTWAMRGGRTDPFGARRALRWLLDPGLPSSGQDLETRVPRHPHATRELFQALGQTPSLSAMREALQALWSTTPPASEADAATFVLTTCPDQLALEARAASASVHVPPEWKQGALLVLADQLLDAGPAAGSVGRDVDKRR